MSNRELKEELDVYVPGSYLSVQTELPEPNNEDKSSLEK